MLVHTDEGVDRRLVGRRRRCPTASCSSACWSGVDPLRTEVRARDLRDGRLPRRPAVDGRGRGLGSGRQGARPAALAAARRPLRAARSPTRRAASCSTPDERAERCLALRDARRARGQAPLPPRRLARRRRRRSPRCARRSATGSRSWSTPTRAGGCPATAAPRWDVATAAQCARALEELGVYWLEEPLRTDDAAGYASLRGLHRPCASRPARWCGTRGEARDLVVRGQVDVLQCDVALRRRLRRRPPPRRARRPARPRVVAAHVVERLGLVANLHAALAFSTVPYVEVPYDPPGLVGRAPRLAAAGAAADRGRRDDRAAARARASASSSTSTRSSAGGSADGDRSGRAALARAGRSRSSRSSSTAPKAGEVLVRVAAAGVCHSDVRLADGELGEGRWPMVLGHEGAGVVEAVGEGVAHVAPGDHVAFSFVPACGACRACRAGRPNLCEPAGAARLAGTLLDGTSRLSLPDGDDAAARPDDRLLRRARPSSPAASAVPIPAELPLWQAALLGCGVVTGIGAVRNVARVAPGDTVCVIGCGGVGLQVVAGARLAGAATDRRRRPEPREARAGARARRDGRGRCDRATIPRRCPRADRRRRRPRVRGGRAARDDPARVGRDPRPAAARRRRARAARGRGRGARRSSSSPTSRCAARTTARATRRASCPTSRGSPSTASSTSRAS